MAMQPQKRHQLKIGITPAHRKALEKTMALTQAESLSEVVRIAIDRFYEQTTLEQSISNAVAELREANEEAQDAMKTTTEGVIELLSTHFTARIHEMDLQHKQLIADVGLTASALGELVVRLEKAVKK